MQTADGLLAPPARNDEMGRFPDLWSALCAANKQSTRPPIRQELLKVPSSADYLLRT
jgi:hypothetical protein